MYSRVIRLDIFSTDKEDHATPLFATDITHRIGVYGRIETHFFRWTGILPNGTWASPGKYRIRVSPLRLYGDADNASDYQDTVTTDIFAIDYTNVGNNHASLELGYGSISPCLEYSIALFRGWSIFESIIFSSARKSLWQLGTIFAWYSVLFWSGRKPLLFDVEESSAVAHKESLDLLLCSRPSRCTFLMSLHVIAMSTLRTISSQFSYRKRYSKRNSDIQDSWRDILILVIVLNFQPYPSIDSVLALS